MTSYDQAGAECIVGEGKKTVGLKLRQHLAAILTPVDATMPCRIGRPFGALQCPVLSPDAILIVSGIYLSNEDLVIRNKNILAICVRGFLLTAHIDTHLV